MYLHLPAASLGKEKIDAQTFADWGVGRFIPISPAIPLELTGR